MRYLLIILVFPSLSFAELEADLETANSTCSQLEAKYKTYDCQQRPLKHVGGGFSKAYVGCKKLSSSEKTKGLVQSQLSYTVAGSQSPDQCEHLRDYGTSFRQDFVITKGVRLAKKTQLYNMTSAFESTLEKSQLTLTAYNGETLICQGEGFNHRALIKKPIKYFSCEANGRKLAEVPRDDQFGAIFYGDATVEDALKRPPLRAHSGHGQMPQPSALPVPAAQ